MNLEFCENSTSNANDCMRKACKDICSTIEELSTINDPEGFCKGEINKVCRNLDEIVTGLGSFNTWLSDKITALKNAENTCRNIAVGLKSTNGNLEGILKELNAIDAMFKGNIREFFSAFNSGAFYGANQGMFTVINGVSKISNNEYLRTVDTLKYKYNMPYKDAVDLMEYLDSIGICTYASAVNKIVVQYATKPEAFEDDFGFPLYIQTDEGETYVNYSEILLDMYIENNVNGYGNDNLQKNEDGTITIKKDAFEIEIEKDEETGETLEHNKKLKYQDYMQKSEFNDYLKTKGGEKRSVELSLLEEKMSIFADEPEKVNQDAIDQLKERLDYDKKCGSGVRIDFFPKGCYVGYDLDSELPFYLVEEDGNSEKIKGKYILEGAHSVFITGNNDEGIYIASWGKEFFVKFEDIINYQVPFFVYDSADIGIQEGSNTIKVEEVEN